MKLLSFPLLGLGLVTVLPVGAATVLNFPDFSDVTGLQINGDAARVGNVLRVTPSAGSQAGSVFSTTAVTLTSEVSFSTRFSFRISNPGGSSDGDGQGADGIVFAVQTNSNTTGGAGGGIGYLGIPNSVGVEFDTWDNGPGAGDPDGNHVSIDKGGALSPNLGTASVATRMNDGQIWYAWIDYDGPNDELEVRLSTNGTRPVAPLLQATVDLTSELGSTNAFVGFTSGTGAAYGDHDILSWEFRDDFEPVGSVPDGGTTALLGLIGFVGLGGLRRLLR